VAWMWQETASAYRCIIPEFLPGDFVICRTSRA
jgi:hypothetical protein